MSVVSRGKCQTTDSVVDGSSDVNALVKVRGLQKKYTRAGGEVVPAVDGIDLDIRRGEIVALVGPSGCGKTTLLRCIAGLESPTAGTIVIDGRTVYDSESRRQVPPERRGISMMFQSYAIWPHMSVAKNVAYPLLTAGIRKSQALQRVRDVLDSVGIAELYDQMPSALSGGQQQRVALARCLVSEPSVMLFDEPLSNVDAKVRASLRLEILEMHHRLGFAALYVTHDQDEAMQIGNRLAVLQSGHFAQFGTPAEIYRRPASRYVAGFVGQTNEWSGELAADGSLFSITVGDFKLLVDRPNVIAQCTLGQQVTALVRPESISISCTAVEATSTNRLNGTVVATMFRGAHTEYLVDIGGRTIVVWSSVHKDFAERQRVYLSFSEFDVRVVPQ